MKHRAIIIETGAVEESTVAAYCGSCGKELPSDALLPPQMMSYEGTNWILQERDNTQLLLKLRKSAPDPCPFCTNLPKIPRR